MVAHAKYHDFLDMAAANAKLHHVCPAMPAVLTLGPWRPLKNGEGKVLAYTLFASGDKAKIAELLKASGA